VGLRESKGLFSIYKYALLLAKLINFASEDDRKVETAGQ